MGKGTFVVGDLHLPFADSSLLALIYKAIEREEPTNVVQVGDLYDMFSQTRFPKNPNVITPERELEEARETAERFWANVRKAAPRASCHQILGNHDIRPLKRAEEKAGELLHLVFKAWEDLFKFRGVETLFDTRDDLVIDGVVYEHGFYGRPGQHLRENMMPTVIGHTHRAWVHFERIRKQFLWELNVGYAADPTHEALSYPRKKWVKWTHGYGIVDSLGPRFCPLTTDK